uniref:AMP-binding enzyme C-terminal domain-containing protein n=1 Tax=Strigops habroptila TaxID=2489341 RepID=A0A672TEG0_STRHB
MAPVSIASMLNDFWLHSLILPFPSTEKQWLSPLCVTTGAGCHVGKANTPSLGGLCRDALYRRAECTSQGAGLSARPGHHPSSPLCFSEDTAVYKDGVYWIEGCTLVDIIKKRGLKIKYYLCTTYADVAVIGPPDMVWGQQVSAVVQLCKGEMLSVKDLKDWSREIMAPYTIPTELIVVEEVPRNQMVKVNKKELLQRFYPA